MKNSNLVKELVVALMSGNFINFCLLGCFLAELA